MIAALQQLQGRIVESFAIEIVDVDHHPVLKLKWGDKVPVLLDGEIEICHYFLDLERLKKHLGTPV